MKQWGITVGNTSIVKAGKVLAAISLSLLLSGCLSQPPKANLAPAPKNVTPPPLAFVEPLPYQLQVGDVMDIKVLMNPELNDQVTVRPDGMISTAVARDIPAYGHTPTELQKELEKRYSKQLVNPQVSVILRSFAPNRVYVLGEVANPGEFITVGPNLTLLQSIARAGGVKNSAGTDKIIIIRRGATEKPEAYAANYMSAVSGVDPSNDVRLASYDVVYVPRSDVGDAYLYFQQYIQQFVPVSFGVNYQVNPTTKVQ